jgi:hypothetical protein
MGIVCKPFLAHGCDRDERFFIFSGRGGIVHNVRTIPRQREDFCLGDDEL